VASPGNPLLGALQNRSSQLRSAASGGPTYFTLRMREEQLAFYPKASPAGININDPIMVRGAFKAFKFWNRYDLVEDLEHFLVENNVAIPATWKPPAAKPPAAARLPLSAAARPAAATVPANVQQQPPIPRIGERGEFDWVANGHLAACPALPGGPGTLTMHRGSAIAFLLCKVGQGLTGIVSLSRSKINSMKVRPKIFLVPIQPSVSNKGDAYPIRPADERATRIYKASLNPITHQQSGSGGASHTQLSDAIKANKKYQFLAQKEGDFIGFTLIKGDARRGIGNRYGFTSASSNTHSFHLRDQTAKHPNCTTEDWGRYIASACDALLRLESDATNRDLVLKDNKSGWEGIKSIYWPTGLPVVKVAESVERPQGADEWD
jgi:hypothetical protein